VTLTFDADAKTKSSGELSFVDWIKQEIKTAHAAASALAKAEKKGEKIASLKSAKLVLPFKDEVDEEGNPTGRIKFVLKNNVSGKSQSGEVFHTRIDLFDAGGKRITTDPKAGNGTIVRASFTMSPYHMKTDDANKFGMAFRFQALQIIELVPFGGGSASSFGFESEDGFDASSGGFDSDTNGAPFEADSDTGDADF
jgi:hypothetical protein